MGFSCTQVIACTPQNLFVTPAIVIIVFALRHISSTFCSKPLITWHPNYCGPVHLKCGGVLSYYCSYNNTALVTVIVIKVTQQFYMHRLSMIKTSTPYSVHMRP